MVTTSETPSFDLESNTNDPAYLAFEVSNISTISTSTVSTVTGVTIDGDQIFGSESRSLVDILMRMHQGQLGTPSYKLLGELITVNESSFFNTFYAQHIDKKFIPLSMSIDDKRMALSVDLVELKTGEDGSPPAEMYEYTTEFTTEFNA